MKHPDAIAWEKWIESEEGNTCSDPLSLGISTHLRHFLENRLWRAFMAGRQEPTANPAPPQGTDGSQDQVEELKRRNSLLPL